MDKIREKSCHLSENLYLLTKTLFFLTKRFFFLVSRDCGK